MSLVIFFIFIFSPPKNFPINSLFNIPVGSSVAKIARILKLDNYIRSENSFIILNQIKKEKLKAGNYIFRKKSNLLEVYEKIAQGKSESMDVKITILEGETNYEIAKKLAQKFKNIDEENFIKLAQDDEGFLFPDTYNLSPDVDEKTAIETFKKTFKEKTDNLFKNLNTEEINRVITIASLIEAEANNSITTKKHISGIIENRLKKKMPLQIDAVFSYIYGHHIKKVLNSHLKVDSPYNTYKYKGLPPGPIGNPGLDSIKAALNPLKTKDLYYLTGKDGKFYYSQTGFGHNKNRTHLK